MSSSLIVERFEQWREERRELVLATVIETDGSTYSKPGHRILLSGTGDHQGLVSGGCLEGDLAVQAAAVLESDAPRIVTYDLRDESDDVFGLGVGCNGLLRILLQPLRPERSYEPFRSIAAAMMGSEHAVVAVVVASGRADLSLGATLVRTATATESVGIPDDIVAALDTANSLPHVSSAPTLAEFGDEVVCLVAALKPIPRLLILGAGADSVPLIELALRLGWRVRVADHRPAYLERPGIVRADPVCVRPGALAADLDLACFDAIVVMSHHLSTDEAYLRELVTVETFYLGLLGPRYRRDRILSAIDASADFSARVHGPVGLDLGSDSPETIALSILAEIQLVIGKADSARNQ